VSAPSTMTCERANQLITELVCGELGADEAASVRAHAESCARCGPELARFARVLAVAQELPMEAPAPAVEQRIMQAAREALSRRAGGAVAIDSGTPSGGIKAWLERLGTWAMSPQVAMASVLLLVVGIGLYALPFGEDGAPAALQLAQEPVSAPPQTATATSAPVEAKEMARLPAPAPAANVARDEAPATEEAKAFSDELAEKGVLRARRAAESKPSGIVSGGKKGDAFGGELDGLGALGAEGGGVTGTSGGRGNALGPAPAPKPAAGASKDRAIDDLLDSNFAPPPPAPEERSAAEAPRRAEPAAPVAAESADYEAAAPVASTREQPAKQKAESAPEPSYATLLADGIAAAQAGNYARAVSLLEPVAASGPLGMRSSARTWLARSLRGLGQCERALTYYAPLVDAPSPPIAILNEAADCYARVGRLAQAEALRMRAKASGGAKAAPVKAAPAAADTKQ
jgi:hypothetical protein